MSMTCNRVKHISPLRKWEYWRARGIPMVKDGRIVYVRGKELDAITEELAWREEHPGQEPSQEVINDVPAQ